MYRKHSQSWLKHIDFMLIDLICLNIAYLMAYIIRHGFINPYGFPIYRNIIVVLTLISMAVSVFTEAFKDVLKREAYIEFVCSLKQVIYVMLFAILYMFMIQQGEAYSRITIFLTGGLYFCFTYIARLTWKAVIKNRGAAIGKRSLLVVTSNDEIQECVSDIKKGRYLNYNIVGVAVIDACRIGEEIDSIPIVSDITHLLDYVCSEWIDEIFINMENDILLPEDVINQLYQVGVVIHKRIAKESTLVGRKQFTEIIGDYTVLTTTMNFASFGQLFLKRMLDIIGGIVGCVFTVILYIFLAPAIKIVSPGPVFFSQERVGMNGKHFKIYKFRTMYMDAEARKAELMKQNKMDDAFMFKMEEDPRIIGSKILPDGTYKKGIGNFIRDYSLDEFPQFWSCLIGDMSLVGTRPPTVNEVVLYAPHHHARLAAKPGITGMWQVSGRSSITDFEEVVKLDTEYINNWSIGLDIKILFKTFVVVFKKEGSM